MMSATYNSYKRLKKLFYWEYETNFSMEHKLSEFVTISADLKAYEKKLYDKNVRIYRYILGHGNQMIFETKDFDILKKWLKSNNYI